MPWGNEISDHASSGVTTPPANAFSITPHDVNDLSHPVRAVYIGGAGDLAVELVSGDTVTYVGLLAGTTKIGRFKKVLSTGTTASDLIGEY